MSEGKLASGERLIVDTANPVHEQFVSGWSVLPPCFGVFMEGVSALSWPHRAGSRLDLMGDFHEQVLTVSVVCSLVLVGGFAQAQQNTNKQNTKQTTTSQSAPRTTTRQTTTNQSPPKQTPAQRLAPILPAQPPSVSNTQKPSPVGAPIRSTSTTPGSGTAEVQADRSSKPGCNQAASADNSFRSKIYGDNFSSQNHHDCDHVGS
jgi:cytoskeletal protein RodZ